MGKVPIEEEKSESFCEETPAKCGAPAKSQFRPVRYAPRSLTPFRARLLIPKYGNTGYYC